MLNLTLDDILKLLAGLGGLLVIYVSVMTANQTSSKTGFDQLREVVENLQKQINAQNDRIEKQEKKIEDQAEMIRKLQNERDEFEDWTRRLIAQIIDAGLKPVPSMRTNE